MWDSDLDDLHGLLKWVEFLEYTVEDALEGARVHAECQKRGTRLPITDIIRAGVAQNWGVPLASADRYFDAVDDGESHRDAA